MNYPDAFIAALTRQIGPAPARHFGRRYLLWVFSVIGLVIGLTLLLPRPDLTQRVLQPDFLLQFLLWLGVFFVSGTSAFVLATPRWPMARGIKLGMCALFAGLAVFAAWLALTFTATGAHYGHGSIDLACICIVSGMGILVSTLLTLILQNNARSTYPLLMAFFMSTAGAGVGMMAVMLTCGHEAPGHVIISHFLPALAFGMGLTLAARRWWHW
ncbi:MAG: DUF1109 domain-containing protein [Sphingobacteriales bacterium]|nr:MAG: DUF1109 domain-containing protein [Sphingobacteriales bacterium]